MTYDKDDLESVLMYLTREYGIEILAGQGINPGKEDVMRLLPDFFSTRHKGDYSMMRMMGREGIMTKLLSLKESGTPDDKCRRLIAIETHKLTENFIPQEVAAKYVNMIAGLMGLNGSAVMVRTVTTPAGNSAAKPQPVPKRPAISDSNFYVLCRNGNAAKVEKALRNGANPNAKSNGSTVLYRAAIEGYADIVYLLLRYGADANTMSDGNTVLYWVAIQGHAYVTDLLLQYGADVNAKNQRGMTALHVVADSDVAKVLLQHGADVNARDKNFGNTALHMC